MKAREFLAQKLGDEVELRNIIKEPLSVDELRRLASRVGGVDELVAPKRRAEAEGLHGEKLLRWLAADGARVTGARSRARTRGVRGAGRESRGSLVGETGRPTRSCRSADARGAPPRVISSGGEERRGGGHGRSLPRGALARNPST